MNSKERVLTAMGRKAPDRVPFDMSFSPTVLQKLYAKYQTGDYLDIMKRLDIDIVDIRGVVDPLWVGPFPKVELLKSGEKYNYMGFTTKAEQTKYGMIEEHSGYVLENTSTIEELKKFRWPCVDWFDFSNMADELKKYKDHAIMATGASVYQHATLVRRLDNLLCDMALEPQMAHFVMDRFTDFYVLYYAKMFESAKGQIDILRIADDLGMQDRMLIGKETFHEFIQPKIKKIVEMAHSYGVLVMFHSCGSIMDFIDPLIDVGVDVLDPIQITAKGMEPKVLKENFGDQICFHGAIDTQYVLPLSGAKEIEENVSKVLDAFGHDGGFILAPSHTIQPDVSIENIELLHKIYRKRCIKSKT